MTQTRLAEFRLEYRLVAHAGPETAGARARARGGRIMSPDQIVDPAAPKVGPPGHWHVPPAPPPGGEVRAR